MTEAHRGAAPVSAGFFAFRTALLPFQELLDWGEGLAARDALHDPAQLERALASDRATLRARLRAVATRPEIRDALFVASPDLDGSFDVWLRDPESEHGQRVERTLVRYFVRMAGRATPFGLFGGHSVGGLGERTRLEIAPRAAYQRHTRLDMDYLFALVDALRRDPSLREVFDYRPNSSLYRAAGRVRYVEARLRGDHRTYHLVAVERGPELDAVLALARDGAKAAALAAALVCDEITLAAADEYVAELIACQILVPDLPLTVTGPEAMHAMIDRFRAHPATAHVAERLERVRAELESIDGGGLGASPERYRATAHALDGLPAQPTLKRLFQVDMVKPAPGATLGRAVVAELLRGVELLRGIHRGPRRGDPLARFVDAFRNRYEQREVPLVEVLDEDMGIGFPPSRGLAEDATPLLQGIDLPAQSDDTTTWGKLEDLLQHQLGLALASGRSEIVLEPRDLERVAAPDPPALPDTFSVSATLLSTSEAELERGHFQLLLGSAYGPSGGATLGRFCHADPALDGHVRDLLRAEEAFDPEALFAEVVHLPEGRTGNILSRPVLREHEIVYLGDSGAPRARQIPVTDLLVSLSGSRVVLRSARLGRRVVPRLTSAHNFSQRSLGTYHFLCALQRQGVVNLSWNWGALESAPFLPRVTAGRLVLSKARWLASRDELARLGHVRGAERFRAVQEWRAERRLPRWIALADWDNTLPVDLDNVLSVDSFVQLVHGREEAMLIEMLPGPDQLCARGPEGGFVHELVMPFVCAPRPSAVERVAPVAPLHVAPTALGEHDPIVPAAAFRRSFPPGSEWLYLKLYCGPASIDPLLRDVLAPVLRRVRRAAKVDLWFFLRYADPDPHLRLRLHGDPRVLDRRVLPLLRAAVDPLLDESTIRRIQLDTYEREVERYGGTHGVVLAERIFAADAEAVLEIVDRLDPDDQAADERWRLALRGIDALLDDLGFDLERKRELIERMRGQFAREFRANSLLRRQLGEKFQKERKALEALLDSGNDAESPLAPGLQLLAARSARLVPIVAELHDAERAGRLSAPLPDLAWSFVHMHVNRLLHTAHRAQELVLYDFLARLYESRAARSRATRKRDASALHDPFPVDSGSSTS